MKEFLLLFLGVIALSSDAFAQPQIHDPAIVGIKHDRVTIEWTTSKKSRGKIHFGETKKLGKEVSDPSFSKGHRLVLRGLKPETVYYFKIDSTDLYTFKTALYEGLDETILKILSPPTVTPVSPNSVMVSWSTNKPTKAMILYGTKGERPKKIAGEFDTTNHILTLSNLFPESRYFYQVSVKDAVGNSVKSSYSSFVTPKGAPTPAILDGPAVVSRKTNGFKIQWLTDRPCKSLIRWGDVPLKSFQKEKNVSSNFSREHMFTLDGLKPNTRYFYAIHLEDRRGVKSISDIFSIRTEIDH
ncbi:MAG: fibronectin type III domain-containing protein [Deltaproteobacteria bacterium]